MNTNFSSFLVLHLNVIHGSICIPYFQYVSVSSMRYKCILAYLRKSVQSENRKYYLVIFHLIVRDCCWGKRDQERSPQNKDLHYNGVVMILFLRLTNYQNPILKGVVNFGLKEKAVIKNLFANLRSKPSQFI